MQRGWVPLVVRALRRSVRHTMGFDESDSARGWLELEPAPQAFSALCSRAHYAHTALGAIMRAYVVGRFGDEVPEIEDVPRAERL